MTISSKMLQPAEQKRSTAPLQTSPTKARGATSRRFVTTSLRGASREGRETKKGETNGRSKGKMVSADDINNNTLGEAYGSWVVKKKEESVSLDLLRTDLLLNLTDPNQRGHRDHPK
ncbi:hypothetical protein NPIL_698781 [Nephila pilipes]|uniref:Uncharacterized protein n=1 Tax=Nephila pilipes TaxID=299642 RepID=A0A8X6PNZ6_NEPPI|nr:hypothetical protein NPIL_698781 [Nephila pilipes]